MLCCMLLTDGQLRESDLAYRCMYIMLSPGKEAKARTQQRGDAAGKWTCKRLKLAGALE